MNNFIFIIKEYIVNNIPIVISTERGERKYEKQPKKYKCNKFFKYSHDETSTCQVLLVYCTWETHYWLKSVHIHLTPNSMFINHIKLEWLAPTKHPFMNFEEILIKRTFTFILYKQIMYLSLYFTQPDSSNSCRYDYFQQIWIHILLST